jgi:hypothetical protein
MRTARHLALAAAVAVAAGCATSFDNAPRNLPETAASVAAAAYPRNLVGRNVVAPS